MLPSFGRSLFATGAADSASPQFTTTAVANVGETIALCFGAFVPGTVNSVTDSAGNTYTIRKQIAGGSVISAIATAPVTSQLASGGTITVNLSASASWINCHAMALVDVATSSPEDGTGDESNTTADAAWNTSDSTTTVAEAILIGCCALRDAADRTHTNGANLTTPAGHETKGGNINFVSQYRVLSATGTYDANGTWSGSDLLQSAAVHVILKGATSGEFFTKAVTVGFV